MEGESGFPGSGGEGRNDPTLDPPSSDPDQTFDPGVGKRLMGLQGRQIGSYTLQSRLGSGGFGEVWLATRSQPDMNVAIKLLRPGVADPRRIARFQAEAQALAMLDHECVATIHEAGVSGNDEPYIAMEYVKGEPITAYCDRRGLSVELRLELMAQVCEAVHHAHARGLIHRDLKPDNILVTEVVCDAAALTPRQKRLRVDSDGGMAILARPKIVDFGLAKAITPAVRLSEDSLTQDLGGVIGTLAFMSPEQASGDLMQVDTRTDVFGLGIVIFF